MSWRHYDEARALACDAERAAPDEHLVPVRQLLAAELATMPVRRVVDVGTGTELWSDRLVRWLSAPVIAVEPSAPMIAVLVSKNVAGVALVQARGEALPLRDGSCGAAWLSTVAATFSTLSEVMEAFAHVGLRLRGRHTPSEGASPTRPDFLQGVERRAARLLQAA